DSTTAAMNSARALCTNTATKERHHERPTSFPQVLPKLGSRRGLAHPSQFEEDAAGTDDDSASTGRSVSGISPSPESTRLRRISGDESAEGEFIWADQSRSCGDPPPL